MQMKKEQAIGGVFYDQSKESFFHTGIFLLPGGRGDVHGAVSAGSQPDGVVFWYDCLSAWLGFEELIFFICPIVWCYSFFHTHNLRRMTEEEFATVEDRFIFADYVNLDRDWKCSPKHRRVFGFVLLLIALSELWKQAMYLMERFFYIPDFAWALSHTVPQIVVAVVILVVALRLMREPKDEETEEADEQAEETDEQEIAEAIAEEENKEM